MVQRLHQLRMAGLIGLMALFMLAPVAGAAPLQQAADSVDAADQALSNSTLVVATVNSSVDGWIAVHIDQEGKPGPVIGHAAAPKGETKNLAIKLDQNVPVGGKVWPMLHIDAGTIGTYEFPGADAPVVINNNIVMKQVSIIAGGASAPSTLPTTGGEGMPLVLLLSALAIVIAGGWLKLRSRA